jgi:hypothetical protein
LQLETEADLVSMRLLLGPLHACMTSDQSHQQ